ncbi:MULTISPECIES: hypothetical protein [unclassified Caballeronia]|uniref:hypothetical protein n=1 Tax=unclassified Caballeronia TaxID=2646786 RepID=UPI00285B1427|nr:MULTISPECIES: hypothetical protein [unclassified Caballeronia]MDR5739294.1 hypothetical protein [Caballeronia sp. LZ016]MDR5807784.1 hypothetical protein [Caballeronia sp. LZ019]
MAYSFWALFSSCSTSVLQRFGIGDRARATLGTLFVDPSTSTASGLYLNGYLSDMRSKKYAPSDAGDWLFLD